MTAQLTTGKKAQFKTLLKQKEALLEKIHNIEESCEGIKNANNVFGVGKKRTSYVLVSRGCIIVELDFPEFNLCKE